MKRENIDPAGQNAAPKDYRFFDPQNPERPNNIFDIDTEAIRQLGVCATELHVLPPNVSMPLYSLADLIRLFPLVEKMQSSDEPLTPADVTPYRRAIKDASPNLKSPDKIFRPSLKTYDRLAAGAGALAVGIPVRRAINRKIEEKFPSLAAEAIETARQNIDKIEKEVAFVAEFENPKQQFVAEIQAVADTTKQAILEHHSQRLAENRDYTPPPPPQGFYGFVTKIYRKIRSFFGFFRRHNAPNQINRNITAYDAAAGIDSTMRSLLGAKDSAREQFPLLFNFVLNRLSLKSKKLPTIDQLAFLAPEILTSLFSALPESEEDAELLSSVSNNPHEFRFVTRFKKRYKYYYLESIQHATRTLLPAIRDILPTEGKQVLQTFNTIKHFLEPAAKAPKSPDKPKLRTRVRNRLRKNKPKPS